MGLITSHGVGHALWDPAWPQAALVLSLSLLVRTISEVTKTWKAVTGRVWSSLSPSLQREAILW